MPIIISNEQPVKKKLEKENIFVMSQKRANTQDIRPLRIAILNLMPEKQKAELEQMKAEGRARFEKFHKARPPFQGLGTPNMFIKPIFPPQHPPVEK